MRRLMKISRRQFGWAVASLGLTIAAILWYSGYRNRSPLSTGVRLSAVEHTVDVTGTVNCTVHVTNVIERRIVIQAELERPLNGQWEIIPCRQPGPMYVSALWVLDPGEVKTVVLPTPLNRGNNVAYRIRVDYWVRERAPRVCYETLRRKLRIVRDVGSALLRPKAPHPAFTVDSSGYAVIGGRGGTPIDRLATHWAYTEEWNSVQQMDAPNPAPSPWFQFEVDWRGVGDP